MKHILLIEDDTVLLGLYAKIFTLNGYDIKQASDIHTAQALLESHRFDAIISDVHVGIDNAIDLLKQHPNTRDALHTIIVHSGSEQYRKTYVSGGMTVCNKPISITEMLDVVAEVANRIPA